MVPAMPCERQPSIVKTSAQPKIGNDKEFETMYDCSVASHESSRQRVEPSQPAKSWITFQVKGLLR